LFRDIQGAVAGILSNKPADFIVDRTWRPWRTRRVNRTAHGLRSISTGDCASGSNFMQALAMPKAAEPRSLTSLREKLIKIGAKVVRHGRYVTFQMAVVVVPRQMFQTCRCFGNTQMFQNMENVSEHLVADRATLPTFNSLWR
jgi:hypothetical protein